MGFYQRCMFFVFAFLHFLCKLTILQKHGSQQNCKIFSYFLVVWIVREMDIVDALELCLYEWKTRKQATGAVALTTKWSAKPIKTNRSCSKYHHCSGEFMGLWLTFQFTWIWCEGRLMIENYEDYELENASKRKKGEREIENKIKYESRKV